LTDSVEADFVLYVLADGENSRVAGYSMLCLSDGETKQPLFGVYYFGAASHDGLPMEQVLATTIHEITHPLVFSSALYHNYHKPNGNPYEFEEVYVFEKVRGKDVIKLALPTVVEKARIAFNCSTLNGVELEEGGGGGTAASHWEKRIMYNDYMSPDADIYDIAYTDITLALFADSGWYKVSYRYSNNITWGHLAGCEFLSEKCVSDSKPLTRDFCVEDSAMSCDSLGLRIGHCDIEEYDTKLPTPFQYFSSPYVGGIDYYLDFCPVVKPYWNGNCRDIQEDGHAEMDLGESTGYWSRCLEGNYSLGETRKHATCHTVDCSASNPIISIGNFTLICPSEGGNIAVPGYHGTITCPPRSQLCREVPCVNNCHGYGYCDKGKCVCEDGSDRCQYGFAGGHADAAWTLIFTNLLLFLLTLS
jgi:leishmanolysin